MAFAEFEIIQRYFSSIQAANHTAIEKGVGDDAAVLNLNGIAQLGVHMLVSADTLVENVHFYARTPPHNLGFKALAINVSDILAMGAKPYAFTLCLSLPKVDHLWLKAYTAGLVEAANMYGVSLIGGDTTRGPLSMSIQIFGTSYAAPLTRSAAQPGDHIIVTGTLGDAAAGLHALQSSHGIFDPTSYSAAQRQDWHYLVQRHCKPIPRQGMSASIAGLHAAIDISDGLLPDLTHICQASGLQAVIDPHSLPLSKPLLAVMKNPQALALIGGEDYELCLTCHPSRISELHSIAAQQGYTVTDIGYMQDDQQSFKSSTISRSVVIQGWSAQETQQLLNTGFRHFNAPTEQT